MILQRARVDEGDNYLPPEKRNKKPVTAGTVKPEPVTAEPTSSSSNIAVPSSSTAVPGTANRESQECSTEAVGLLDPKSQVILNLLDFFFKI